MARRLRSILPSRTLTRSNPTEIEEIPMRIAKMFVALTATALALAACANHKEPAEKAIAQVESALAEIRADAEKYTPEELKGLDESVATLKRGFGNKRYSEVLTAQPSVASAVTALKETIAKAKADSRSDPGRGAGGMDRTQRECAATRGCHSGPRRHSHEVAQAAQGRGQGHIRNHQDRLRDRESRLDLCNLGIRCGRGRGRGAQGARGQGQGRRDSRQAGHE